SDDAVKEITSLGLKYSLLTQYTSFVAVLEKVRNTNGAEDVQQPLPLPVGVNDLAVGSEPDLIWLAALGVLLGLFAIGYRRWRSHSHLASMKSGRVKRGSSDWFQLLSELPRSLALAISWAHSTIRRRPFFSPSFSAPLG